ncbi:TRAP transporter large permease [Ammoniphilus sp. CFH 90114]|uniref:TRAP transporter large permease n=1 Tax=Ammoniphilus sp. CFH 90114 TaxID=2493665 RepID=UPI00100E9C1A|nr:TRAP transporter large permease [Ammoniphilus sp. CFH 90114]RXT07214.1 TRAP transporter large permease [Ammoniphilus sp. CFH 90114]
MTATLFSLLGTLFLLRVPIAICLALATVAIMMTKGDFAVFMLAQRMFAGLHHSTLMAIPGFIFAGAIMAKGGVSKYLIEALRAWLGHITGGLSVVTVLACMIFAAISGSSPATAAAVGSILIPGMVAAGYPRHYAMGLVAASGTLGILIPPSIPLIIYGTIAEESIGKLFAAGVIPGLLLGGVLLVTAIIVAKVKGYGGDPKADWPTRWRASRKAFWGAILPFLILGGIYTGAVTPTEASVVAAAYSLFVSIFIYREMSLATFRLVMKDTVNTTSMIFLIIAGAMLFSLYLTNESIPQSVAMWIGDLNLSFWGFMLLINLMFFVMGTFLEAIAIILITLPILLPIVKSMGIDPIHFAIIMTVNMELAMITPPVGLNLFVVSGVSRAPLGEAVKGVLPFILIMIAVLFILIGFEDLSMYLTKFVGY